MRRINITHAANCVPTMPNPNKNHTGSVLVSISLSSLADYTKLESYCKLPVSHVFTAQMHLCDHIVTYMWCPITVCIHDSC